MRAELLHDDGVGAGRDPEAGVVHQLIRCARKLQRRAVYTVVQGQGREAEDDPGVDAGPAAVLPDQPPNLDPLGEIKHALPQSRSGQIPTRLRFLNKRSVIFLLHLSGRVKVVTRCLVSWIEVHCCYLCVWCIVKMLKSDLGTALLI